MTQLQERRSNLTTRVLSCTLWVAIGISVAVQIKVGPTLLGSDVIILFIFPVVLYTVFQQPGRIAPQIFTILLLLFLWAAAASVSDIVNDSSALDRVRGLSIIVVFAVNLLAFGAYIGGRRHHELSFAAAMAVGMVIREAIKPDWSNFSEIWKFEIGLPLVVFTMILLDVQYKFSAMRLLVHMAALAFFAVVSALLDFRSLSAFLILCFVYLFKKLTLAGAVRKLSRTVRDTKSSIDYIKPILLVAITIAGIYLAYQTAVSAGWLGRGAAQRFAQQQSSRLGVVIGGRPEILISSYAIFQKPLLGFGSWPQNCELVALYNQLKSKFDIESNQIEHGCLIPTHSHLFGSWVSAGILAVPIWLYVLWIFSKWCIRALRDANFQEVAPFFMGCVVIWNVLFSPFSGRERVTDAFYISVVLSRFAKAGQKP